MEVSMETPASTKFENKNKMADSCFAISNQSNVEQLKENSKNQNTLKATQTWLKVLQNWATERKEMLQVLHAEIPLLRI